jgi:hypothetical protein
MTYQNIENSSYRDLATQADQALIELQEIEDNPVWDQEISLEADWIERIPQPGEDSSDQELVQDAVLDWQNSLKTLNDAADLVKSSAIEILDGSTFLPSSSNESILSLKESPDLSLENFTDHIQYEITTLHWVMNKHLIRAQEALRTAQRVDNEWAGMRSRALDGAEI